MNINFIKMKMLEKLWEKEEYLKIDFSLVIKNQKWGNEYRSLVLQIDNFIAAIQDPNFIRSLKWLPLNYLTDDDWANFGVIFINRKSNFRKIITNIKNTHPENFSESIGTMIRDSFRLIEGYKEEAINPNEFEAAATKSMVDALTEISEKNAFNIQMDLENIVHNWMNIFDMLCHFFQSNYILCCKNGINFEKPEKITELMVLGTRIYSDLLLKVMVTSKHYFGKNYYVLFIKLCKKTLCYFWAEHLKISQENITFMNELCQKSHGYFANTSFLYYNEYLFYREIAMNGYKIDSILIQENKSYPRLFNITHKSGENNAVRLEQSSEYNNIVDFEEKVRNTNFFISEVWGNDHVIPLWTNTVFRELYVINTPYSEKNDYMKKIINKVLNGKDLTFEQKFFLTHKINRGIMCEYDMLDDFPIYTNMINEFATFYCNAFKLLNFGLCVSEIRSIFKTVLGFLCELFDIKYLG